MRIGSGEHRYDWVDNWAVIPDSAEGRANGRTHGIVVARDGSVIVFHVGNPAVLVFDAAGTLIDAWGDRFPGAHGLTLVTEGDAEYLWLTDYVTGEVVKTTLTGETVLSLPLPDLDGFDDPKYAPTWVTVFEERSGGNGDIWVADGYGAAYVHRYDRDGRYQTSINGTEGAGRFRHPHGIYMDARRADPELYVADRMNRRIQVFDPDGKFKRLVPDAAGTSACAFIPHADFTLMPEAPYRARITVLDPDDRVVCTLGENDAVCARDGFPNDQTLARPGRFVAPHSAATDADGNIYVVEWVTGGRITKLARAGAVAGVSEE
jgi:DNA-binding beta-propeller fold protein YncE